MTLLALDIEEKVHALLNVGMDAVEIAKHLRIKTTTVRRIRAARESMRKLSKKQRQRIVNLVKAGVPERAIESQTRLPINVIRDVRRCAFLQRRKNGLQDPRECPTCGNMMFPESRSVYMHDKFPYPTGMEGLDGGQAAELCRLAIDMVNLDATETVPNPLFFQLARRAEELLKKIYRRS